MMKVLYATDGSIAAEDARILIQRLFRRDVEITVITVTHSWSLVPEHLMIELDPISGRRAESKEIVRFASSKMTDAGFTKVSTRVSEGPPGPELVKLSAAYDLLVLGSGSHSWLGNRLLGSVSTHVLHSAACSVLIVHEAESSDDARVLVGVDGSQVADDTTQLLARLLDPTRCALEVMSVVQISVPSLSPALMGPPIDPEILARGETSLCDGAAEDVDRAVSRLREIGFSVTSKIERGSPTTKLLEEAQDAGCDLVVVGSRGLGPIRRSLLGSVSDQVARLTRATLVGRFSNPDDISQEGRS